MKRKLLIFIIIILILQGCSSEVVRNPDVPMQTVIDQIGREVEVPIEVNRIATLFAITGHVTVMLGEGEKIVAVNNGLKRDILLTEICPTILDAFTPKDSGSINIEELVRADPDVVFIESDVAASERETDKLDEFNIPYIVINFNTIEEQQDMIRLIGKILNQEDRAKEYIMEYNDILELIQNNLKELPEEERYSIYHSVNEAYRTDPKESLTTEWIQMSGGQLVSLEDELEFLDNRYFASIEQLLEWNPEVILVNEEGVDQYIMDNEKWQAIKAVKNEQVYLLPNGISRWGHPNSLEVPLGALWTAITLYPDYFSDFDHREFVKDFYSNYFDLHLTEDKLDKLLSGKDMRIDK